MKPWFVVDDADLSTAAGYGTSRDGNPRKAGRLAELWRQWRCIAQ